MFGQGKADQWLTKLKAANVLCSEVTERYNVEYFNEENFIKLGMIQEFPHPEYGLMKYACNTTRLLDTAPLEGRRTPLLGEHNREALIGVGYSNQEIDALYESGVLLTES